MTQIADHIPGYAFGSKNIALSPVSLPEWEELKKTVGFDDADERWLRLAGEVLTGQTKEIVDHWRSGIIASIPHLARHSRSPDGKPLPDYLAASNVRFEQWILDTCRRPYDQNWLDYQHEIALRHSSLKKNKVDDVQSTPYVPLRDVTAFVATMNQTLKPYLSAKGNSTDEVEQMHRAWCKSMQLQLALWTKAYMDAVPAGNEW